MKDRFNKVIKIVAFTLCATVLFSFVSKVCERKTYDGPVNYMAKLNEFYSMKEDSLDYICVGSSHMYCTINPLEVWKETGAAGFVLATQQQPLMASYHYIKEAFKTQSPKYIILEGYMVTREDTYDPAVLYDAIDPLKPSFNKFQMINNLVQYDQRPNYYLNILKYHTRWSQMTLAEVKSLFKKQVDTYKGYVPLQGDFVGENVIPDYENTKDIQLSEFNLKVLNDIYELTTEHNAELILMFAPYDANNSELCEKIKAEINWAMQKNVTVLDYAQLLNTIGIDPESDYYDAGHLDISGAAKVSAHFAKFLSNQSVGENKNIDTKKWKNDYDTYVVTYVQ